MFTGIIEEIGKVKSVVRHYNSIKLTIQASEILEDIKIGDSITTNGICLTVTAFDTNSFTADVMPETMKRTNFKDLKVNDMVNLERAMPANGRFGGHIVKDDTAVRLSIATSPEILRLIVEKGSIAIDGISLTVTEVNNEFFSVSVIQHTQSVTTLTSKHIGDTVNLENDIIGKYVMRFVSPEEKKKGISYNFLLENGF